MSTMSNIHKDFPFVTNIKKQTMCSGSYADVGDIPQGVVY